MTADEMLCRWAEQKYELEGVTKVDFIHSEGWQGTDVTPGYPDEMWVEVTVGDDKRTVDSGVELVPGLIREIAEFAAARTISVDPNNFYSRAAGLRKKYGA